MPQFNRKKIILKGIQKLLFMEGRGWIMGAGIQYIVYLVVLIALAVPLGTYIGKVMNGERVFLSRVCSPCEKLVYRIMHIDCEEDMGAKKYVFSVIAFHIIGFLALFFILLLQGILPLNPQKTAGNSWHQAFNMAVSYITNTNWQSSDGESSLSYFSQMMGLTVQNFLSAAVGMAVLFAVIRGFTKEEERGIGSFWVDLTRSVIYVLLPLATVGAILLASQGVVQSFRPYEEVPLLEAVAADGEGNLIKGAAIDKEAGKVTVDGEEVEGAVIIDKEMLPLGPAASQISIKQLGSNGGGFFGANSSHPLENPSIFSNLIEMLFLLLIPVSLCFTFGRNVKDRCQGIAIFMAMLILLILAMGICGVNEQAGTPQLAREGSVAVDRTDGGSGGNMEGKESRFGIASSVTWTAWTTAASNGSVNSMLDSYTPIGGLVPMLLIQLGEVVFGGVGCGMYTMLSFVILTVFIAGLMVGRTPEYLGKKMEPFEMKMAVLCCLATPVLILVGSGIAMLLPATTDHLNNAGAHGLSEVLYAFSSVGGNNGSAFAGFHANTVFINLFTGLLMLGARFIPMLTMLFAAGSLAGKRKAVQTAGTLPTGNGMFVFLLIFVVLLVGALSFFPALSLGPIAEYFQMTA